MPNFPNKKDRILVLVLWFCFFLPAVCSCIFLLAFQDLPTILTAAISIPGTIFLSILIKPISKGFFLKYMFNQKKFKEMYKEAVKKFDGASKAFLDEHYERTHNQYLLTGDIYYRYTVDDDKWLYSDKANIQGLLWITDILNKSIVDRRGFNYFIDMSNALTHSGELVFHTLNNSFYSGELRYLLLKVYEDTGFNLEDNGLSKEYTEKIKSLREKVEKEYDNMLYNFEDEVDSIYNLLKEKAPVIIAEEKKEEQVS